MLMIMMGMVTGLLLDAEAVWNWLDQKLSKDSSYRYLYGQSLGSAVAVKLANLLETKPDGGHLTGT